MNRIQNFGAGFEKLIVFVLVLSQVFITPAEAQFNVNLVVKPPVSSVYRDYEDLSNKVIITIQNTTNQPYRFIGLQGEIIDKNVERAIHTRYDYMPPVFLTFNAFETKTIIIDPVQLRFLRRDVVETYGGMEEVFLTGFLPEGNWELCVRAVSFEDGVWSQASPYACFPLNFTRANPPVIISPYNNQTVPSLQPNIVFSWTPPAGNAIGAQIVYDLYAVKLLPEQSPNEAIDAAVMYKANNPFIQTNLTANQYVTRPYDLKLDTGVTYAVQVVARDLNKQVAFQNNGRSEVVVFKYGEEKQATVAAVSGEDFSLSILAPSKDKDTLIIGPQQDFYLNWGWLYKNNLFNPDSVSSFRDKNIRSYRVTLEPGVRKSGRKTEPGFNHQITRNAGTSGSGNNYAVGFYQSDRQSLESAGLKNDFWYKAKVEALNENQQVIATANTGDFNLRFGEGMEAGSVEVSGQLRYQFDGYAENYPIPNTSIRIYADDNLPGTSEFYTKTDKDGNFITEIAGSKAAANNDSYKIEIVSDYYRQIDSAIFKLSDTTSRIRVGQLVTRAYNYSLTVRVEKGFSNYKVVQDHSYYDPKGKLVKQIDTVLVGVSDTAIQQFPAGLPVRLYRKKRPSYLPPVEGMINQLPAVPDIIPIAEGKTATETGSDGKQRSFVKFERLLCNVFNDDVYYIQALQPGAENEVPLKDELFEAPEQEFVFKRTESVDPTHYETETKYRIISKDPPRSSISGQLLYQWPGDPGKTLRPLANRKFSIVVEYLVDGKPFKPFDGIMENKLFMNGYLESAGIPYSTGDAGQVMASGVTDENGRFTIQAVNLNEKGVIGSGEVESRNALEKPPIIRPGAEDILGGVNPIAGTFIRPTDLISVTASGQTNIADGRTIFNQQTIGSNFGVKAQQALLTANMNPGISFRSGLSQQFQQFGFLPEGYKGNLAYSQSGLQSHSAFITHNHKANLKPIQRVYRIRLEDQNLFYYPDKNIIVQPLKATDIGPVTVMVKEVKWNIKAVDKESGNAVTPIQAVIFRDPSDKKNSLPQGEGDGRYERKKLIKPQFGGNDVGLPAKPGQQRLAGGNIPAQFVQNSQWQINQSIPANFQIFSDAPSFPDDSYEWLAETATNKNGIAAFDRLLSGFHQYYVELASNPQSGSPLFYHYAIQSLDAYQGDISFENNHSPRENGRYWDERKTDIPIGNITIKMEPLPSRIGGRVIDKSSGQGIAKALVVVKLKAGGNEKMVWAATQDTSGYFEVLNVFDLAGAEGVKNIDVEMEAFSTGYKQEGIKKQSLSKTGRQYIDNILMVPGGVITGFIKNKKGEPVEAYIKRGDGLVVNTGTAPAQKVSFRTPGQRGTEVSLISDLGQAGQFAIPAPSGREATILIIPKDVGYFTDSITLNIREGVNNLNDITVYRRMHRMSFFVKDEKTGENINGAKVSLSEEVFDYTKGGMQAAVDRPAELNFENVSVDNYALTIEGPAGQGYIPKVINLKNEESRSERIYTIQLKKGEQVRGTVTLDGKPVAGAKVYLDVQQETGMKNRLKMPPKPGSGNTDGSSNSAGGLPEIATFSDVAGNYTLTGIPVSGGIIKVIATLDTTFTVAGDEKIVNLNNHSGINLQLTSYQQMDIKTLYGFPLNIEKLEPGNNANQVKVTALVDLSKGVSDFTFMNESKKQIRISDIVFEGKTENGKTVGQPVVSNVQLDATSSLKLSYLNKYNVSVTRGQGAGATGLLEISKNSSGQGVLNGFVHIVDNSFNFPGTYLNFTNKDQFYLGKASGNQIKNNLDAIIAGTGNVTKEIYHLSNSTGKPIQFKFIQFNTSADPLHSYIDEQGRIHLDISMQCHIPNAKPENFSLHAGNIVLDNDQVYPSSDTSSLSVQIEKWKLEIRNWTVDPMKGGIYSTNGLIKTGKLDIPFSEFNLRSDMLVMDKFKVGQLSLGGGVKLLEGINEKNAMILYDSKTGSDMSGHWKLTVSGTGGTPAAVVKNLSPNGQQKTFLNQDVNLEYIELLSNGEDILTIQQSGKPMSINQNGLAQFKPGMIFSGPDYFQITGSLDIPAPRVVPMMATLQFTGKPSSLSMELEAPEMSFEGKGYVNFFSNTSQKSTITSNKITIPGFVQEKNGFNPITGTFYADGNSVANARYHVDLEKGFVLNLTSEAPAGGKEGDYNLKISSGGMEVPQGTNDWNLLSFTGNLLTNDATLKAKGNNPSQNKMTFVVKGDIDVSGEALSVSNIDFPFGKMNLVYEFPNKRLLGSLTIPQGKQFGVFQTGGGNINMEIGSKGWYFLGAVKMHTPIPLLESVNTGFLLGNRNFDATEWPAARDVVLQFSWDKSTLCWLQDKKGAGSIGGIFMTSSVNLLDKELGFGIEGVADFKLIAKVGAELSQLANFQNWGYQFSTGVYGKVLVGASALGVSAKGEVDIRGAFSGKINSNEICVGGEAGADLKFSADLDLGVKEIHFGSLEVSAVIKAAVSNKGISKDFYLGSTNPVTCDSQSTGCN